MIIYYPSHGPNMEWFLHHMVNHNTMRAGVCPFWKIMVFILDGCSKHVAQAWCKKWYFPKKTDLTTLSMYQMSSSNRNSWFAPFVRIEKWATMGTNEYSRSNHPRAWHSDQPSYKSTTGNCLSRDAKPLQPVLSSSTIWIRRLVIKHCLSQK